MIRTKDVLIEEYGSDSHVRERGKLQELGEQLDRETKGHWVCAATCRRALRSRRAQLLVVDAVRTAEQIRWLREVPGFQVVHFHLSAPLTELRRRFEKTRSATEPPTYDEVMANETESRVDDLRQLTPLRISTRWQWQAPRVIALDARLSIWWLRARQALGTGLVAIVVGTPLTLLLVSPIVWLWWTSDQWWPLLVAAVAMYFAFAWTIGAAVTRASPVERDPTEGSFRAWRKFLDAARGVPRSDA
jgi:hypothetical protein